MLPIRGVKSQIFSFHFFFIDICYSDHKELYKELKILKLDDIFNFSIAKFVYETLCGESPQIFSDWFTYQHMVHSHATTSSTFVTQADHFDVGSVHQSYSLFINRCNLSNYGGKMIRVSGPILWNGLPYGVQDASSIYTFKFHLKSFLIDKYGVEDCV